MKKLLLFTGLLLLSILAYAKQVEEHTAKIVGQNFLHWKANSEVFSGNENLELAYKETVFFGTNEEQVLYYVFNVNAIGFVIVAGMTRCFLSWDIQTKASLTLQTCQSPPQNGWRNTNAKFEM